MPTETDMATRAGGRAVVCLNAGAGGASPCWPEVLLPQWRRHPDRRRVLPCSLTPRPNEPIPADRAPQGIR